MVRKGKMTEPKDNRYMLFLYGDFSDSEEITKEMSIQFITVTSSEYLKFTYGEYGAVLHFRSKETFSDLKEYVDMVFNDITEQYFLIEVNGNFDIKMPRKLKKDFLNIDGQVKKEETKTGGIKIDEVKEEKRDIIIDMFYPIVNPNLFFKENVIEDEPTVDEILDKITEKGIESLTERETKILEDYGKRKNGR